MANTGGLGGLGGMRSTPNSSVVGYMPTATDWRDDWQSRYDAETAAAAAGRSGALRSTTPSQINSLTQPLGRLNPDNNQWYYEDANGDQQISPNPVYGRDELLPGGVSVDDKGYLSINESLLPFGKSAQDVMQELSDRSLHPEQGWSRAVDHTPRYSGLIAEKERLAPIMEQQARNQQGYSIQNGNNMLNGVLDPSAYEQPGFGQVTGNFGQDTMGAPAPAGVDMSFTASADPTLSNNGVYNPSGNARTRPWWVPQTSVGGSFQP